MQTTPWRRALFAIISLVLLGTTAATHPLRAETACPQLDLMYLDEYGLISGSCLIGGEDQGNAVLNIPTGPAAKIDGIWRGETQLRLTGQVNRRIYVAPAGATTLDAFRTYRDSMMDLGFNLLFECSGPDCGLQQAMGREVIWPRARVLDTLGDVTSTAFTGLRDDHYVALQSPDGLVTLGVYIAQNTYDRFPETYERAIVHLDMVWQQSP